MVTHKLIKDGFFYSDRLYQITEQCDLCNFINSFTSDYEYSLYKTKCITLGKYNKKSFHYCENHSDKEINKFIKKFRKKHNLL